MAVATLNGERLDGE
ncbi:hypothetical protein ACUOA8_18845, partial [Escherichia sp. SS-MK2]